MGCKICDIFFLASFWAWGFFVVGIFWVFFVYLFVFSQKGTHFQARCFHMGSSPSKTRRGLSSPLSRAHRCSKSIAALVRVRAWVPGEEGGRVQRCPPRSPAGSRDALRPCEGNAKAIEENLQAEEERTICAPIAPAGWARREDGWCP